MGKIQGTTCSGVGSYDSVGVKGMQQRATLSERLGFRERSREEERKYEAMRAQQRTEEIRHDARLVALLEKHPEWEELDEFLELRNGL